MTSPQLAQDSVQVALLSTGACSSLAIGHLARHFGLNAAEAEALLAQGRGVIAPDVSRAAAGAALPMLVALGLQIAILPKAAEPVTERFDLSIRLKDADAIHRVRPVLRRLGWPGDPAPADFCGPAGLEITGLSQDRAEDVNRSLRALRGVSVTLCPQSAAAYDVFAPIDGLGEDMAAILRHISVLACSAPDHCPQIAVNLNHHMMTHLLTRFPKAGLIGVNQAFQRYHLRLTGTGRMPLRDMMDFLATRGCAPSEAATAMTSRRGLRLETGLTRVTAKQFVADYAAIGMTVRADLALG